MSTHDIGQARRLAEDVVFLLDGQLAGQGPAARILDGEGPPGLRAYMEGRLS